MARACYRTIDKPQLMFGLEAEDIALVTLGGGLGCLLIQPFVPGVLSIATWIFLAKFKSGKPAGCLLHYFYSLGVDLPGHAPSPKNINLYGAYAANPR